MAVSPRATPDPDETRRAFDAVAAEYDASNRQNTILEAMRARSLATLQALVPAGARVLDLGCGPGTDFPALLDAGYRVTAVDGSAGMVEEARRRARSLAEPGLVEVHRLAIEELHRLPAGTFDAVYSSFGPLNCVPRLDEAAALIGERLRPGGVLVASVIGRVCPWEIACHAWKRDWARIGVRFAQGFVPVPLGTGTIWTRYYSPAEFERPFAEAGFARIVLRALGVLVPPPYMSPAATRHAAATLLLQAVEDRVASWPGLRHVGDHFLIGLRRCR